MAEIKVEAQRPSPHTEYHEGEGGQNIQQINYRAVCDAKDQQHIPVLFQIPNPLPHNAQAETKKRWGGEELRSLHLPLMC